MSRVLVVDNHDSFVHTLVGYLHELGAEVELVEADEIADAAASLSGFDAVLISPGPGAPRRRRRVIAVVRAAAEIGMPLLGVCLGHQALAEAFGARSTTPPSSCTAWCRTCTTTARRCTPGWRTRSQPADTIRSRSSPHRCPTTSS